MMTDYKVNGFMKQLNILVSRTNFEVSYDDIDYTQNSVLINFFNSQQQLLGQAKVKIVGDPEVCAKEIFNEFVGDANSIQYALMEKLNNFDTTGQTMH